MINTIKNTFKFSNTEFATKTKNTRKQIKNKQTEIPTKINLLEDELPTKYYNIKAVMKNKPAPMIHPATFKPIKKEELLPLFCEEVVEQELNTTDEYIGIPKEVQEAYKKIRPSPLIRATNLEKALGTKAKLYYKFEGNNTSGSHKLNSALAQVYYAKQQGITHITTETGAGQWGTALSIACKYYEIPLDVFMVKSSYEQKPDRRTIMQAFGANIIASPSMTTNIGKQINKEHPNSHGSLGCAISEAVEITATTKNCKYLLGSVLDHVLLHQSIIGLETKTALEKYDIKPDILISCVGGGSNFGGFIAPFVKDKINRKSKIKMIAVEPASCPTLTKGKFAYDFGDTGKMTPLMKMYTLGSSFMPNPIHAGGLRYHGISSIISQLYHDKIIEAVSYKQSEIFEAALLFAKEEGILPAPESSHSIKHAIIEAKKGENAGKNIIFVVSGTGFFDLTGYRKYLENEMKDVALTDEELQEGFKSIPNF